ncbi:hypothetical protein M8494_15785 [Serratia ureilytica]
MATGISRDLPRLIGEKVNQEETATLYQHRSGQLLALAARTSVLDGDFHLSGLAVVRTSKGAVEMRAAGLHPAWLFNRVGGGAAGQVRY